MRGLRHSLLIGALVIAGPGQGWAVEQARSVEACVWGQPGYRDCVAAKIERKREQDRQQGQESAPRERFPTVPLEQRAPTYPAPPRVAIPSPSQARPVPPPSDIDERQWQMDLQRYRDHRRHALRRSDDLLQLDWERQRLDNSSSGGDRFGVGQRQMDLNILRGQTQPPPLPSPSGPWIGIGPPPR